MVGEKTRAVLAAHRSAVERNVQLIRLRTDLVERVDWDELRVQPPDGEAFRDFFTGLGTTLPGAQSWNQRHQHHRCPRRPNRHTNEPFLKSVFTPSNP